MGRLRIYKRNLKNRHRHGTVLKALPLIVCIFSIVVLFETYQPFKAIAHITLSPDFDNDVLPDPFEDLYGTSVNVADTDGDTFIDGIEYVLRTNPQDDMDYPVLRPGMRVAAYKVDKAVKLSIILLPGDFELIDKFVFYMTYYGDASQPDGMGQIDLTSIIPFAVSEFCYTNFNGYLVVSITICIPENIIKDLAPVSIGIGVKLGGESFVDVGSYSVSDGQVVKYMTDGDILKPGTFGYMGALTPDLPPGWEPDQVCETEMEEVSSNDGISTYEITEAQCKGIMKQFCSPSDCAALVGTTIVTIDNGYIHAALE